MSSSLKNCTILITCTLSLNLSQPVLAGGADSTLTNENSNSISNNQGTSKISPPTNPPSYNDYDSYSSYSSYSSQSSLNYPHCNGSCGFGIFRVTPGNNGSIHKEGVVGIITEFDSPNKRAAKAYQQYYEAFSNRMIQQDAILLLEKIADAVTNCQDNRANLLAVYAAKKLPLTPEEILSRASTKRRNCNSPLNAAK